MASNQKRKHVRGVHEKNIVRYGISGKTYQFKTEQFQPNPVLVSIELGPPPKIAQHLFDIKLVPYQPYRPSR